MAGTQNKWISPQTPFSRTAVATAAETTFHNPTNAVMLFDRGASGINNPNGLRISSLYAIARAAISTNPINCQIYTFDGTSYTLIDSALIQAGTPSALVANQKINFSYADDNPLFIEPLLGVAVAIGTATTNGIAFFCSGGKY
jgi:hypothetical protein